MGNQSESGTQFSEIELKGLMLTRAEFNEGGHFTPKEREKLIDYGFAVDAGETGLGDTVPDRKEVVTIATVNPPLGNDVELLRHLVESGRLGGAADGENTTIEELTPNAFSQNNSKKPKFEFLLFWRKKNTPANNP